MFVRTGETRDILKSIPHILHREESSYYVNVELCTVCRLKPVRRFSVSLEIDVTSPTPAVHRTVASSRQGFLAK